MTQVTIRPGEELALVALQQVEAAARKVCDWYWDEVDEDAARDMEALRIALGRLDAVRATLVAAYGDQKPIPHSRDLYTEVSK